VADVAVTCRRVRRRRRVQDLQGADKALVVERDRHARAALGQIDRVKLAQVAPFAGDLDAALVYLFDEAFDDVSDLAVASSHEAFRSRRRCSSSQRGGRPTRGAMRGSVG